MKKFALIPLVVLLVLTVGGCSKNQSIKNMALEKVNFFYGDNEQSNKILEAAAQADGWYFTLQKTSNPLLKPTNIIDAPYTTSHQVMFTNPSNKNIKRVITKSYIFDGDNYIWVPLTETVLEINHGNLKEISSYKLWQRSYGIPFSK
ncbi:MAG: hypothetical protein WC545_01855 [Patescibacteria group bacterium]